MVYIRAFEGKKGGVRRYNYTSIRDDLEPEKVKTLYLGKTDDFSSLYLQENEVAKAILEIKDARAQGKSFSLIAREKNMTKAKVKYLDMKELKPFRNAPSSWEQKSRQ